jgi:hypothetical protein
LPTPERRRQGDVGVVESQHALGSNLRGEHA